MTREFTKKELLSISGLDAGALFYCSQQGLIAPVAPLTRGVRPRYDVDAVLRAVLLASVQGRGSTFKNAAEDIARLREQEDFWGNLKKYASTHETWVTVVDAADDVADEAEGKKKEEGLAFAQWIATRDGRLSVEIFDPAFFTAPVWTFSLRAPHLRRHVKAVSFINVTAAVRRVVALAG